MGNLIETTTINVEAFRKTQAGQAEPLHDSIEIAEKTPVEIAKKFYTYYSVIRDLFELSQKEISVISSVNEKLGVNNGADKFLEVFKPYEEIITCQLKQIGDMENPHNQFGIMELGRMMNNAWDIKQTEPEWKPTDGDKKADEVIWGFVKGATDPEIDIDFSVCHGIERILTAYWQDEEYTKHKDWLLCALNDVVAIRGLNGWGHEANILDRWSKPRPNGLGWIGKEKLEAYKKIVPNTKQR